MLLKFLFIGLYGLVHPVISQTTTPVFTPRTNPDFGGSIITTAESLQGTLNTNTQVTQVTPTATTRATSTTSTRTETTPPVTTTPSVPTTQPNTATVTTPNDITSTTAAPTTAAPTTATQLTTTTSTTTIVNQPPANVYYSTSTIYTTQTIGRTFYSTRLSTVTYEVPVTSTYTQTEIRTDAVTTETIYGATRSTYPVTTTIAGSTTTSSWRQIETAWSKVVSRSTLVLPVPSYGLETSTVTNRVTSTFYVPTETVISSYEASTYQSLNQTYTTYIPTESTSTRFQIVVTTIDDIEYEYYTVTGTDYTTFTLSNDLWVGSTQTIDHTSVIVQEPRTSTIAQITDFIYGLDTQTQFTTITQYIPETTVYVTRNSYITTTVTEYIQNDATIYPVATVTYTYTSSPTSISTILATITTQIPVTVTSTSVSIIPPVTSTVVTTAAGTTVSIPPETITATSIVDQCAPTADSGLAGVFTINEAVSNGSGRSASASNWLSIAISLFTIMVLL